MNASHDDTNLLETRTPPLGTLTFNGTQVDLGYYLTQTYDDISTASVELPAIIEWINIQLQEAVEKRLRNKQLVREAEATAYFHLRDGDFESLYGGKMTENAIAHAISLDENVQACYDNYAKSAALVSRLSSLQNSLAAKLDLVRSTESTRRRICDFENQ